MYTSGENYKTLEQLMKTYEAKTQNFNMDEKDGSNYKNKRGMNNANIDSTPQNPFTKEKKIVTTSKSPKKQSRPLSVGTGTRTINAHHQSSKKSGDDYELLDINTLLLQEEDERFRYLLKYGNIKRIEKNNSVIFAELPQIPGTLVFYRKMLEKEKNPERLFLDQKELTHIPLLEGEEALKLLSLKNNQIETIQNLVSLPNLIYLDLSNNRISDLENFQDLINLRVLIVAKNRLTKIKNLETLLKLEILDLHGNYINNVDGLKLISDLRTLNLKNNAVSSLDDFSHLAKLTELNVSMNKIDSLEPLTRLKNLSKLFLSKNQISKIRNIKSLKYLRKLSDLEMDDNPVSENKFTYYQTVLDVCEALQTLDTIRIDKIKEELAQSKNEVIHGEKESRKKESRKIDSEDDDDDNDQQAEHNKTIDIADVKNKSHLEKDQETDQTKIFSKSQSNFKRKSEEGVKSKGSVKAVSKFKSLSPHKKIDQQYENDSKQKNTGKSNSQTIKNISGVGESGKDQNENDTMTLEPEKVIQIIKEQFQEEIQRIEKLRKHGITTRKELYKDSLLEGGHAEMENNNILFLYGNAFEVMLPNPSFQSTIEEIHFQYVIFDLLVQTKYMNYLKQYKNLRKIVLSDNQIHSFLQIAKLEALPTLRILSIKNNPISSCELLKEFVIYRFPELVEFNDTPIEENQKINAKNKFKEFDNVLIFPLEFYKDNYKGQAAQKVVDEYSETVMKKTITESIELKNKKEIFEILWSSYLNDLIKLSLNEIKVNKNSYY